MSEMSIETIRSKTYVCILAPHDHIGWHKCDIRGLHEGSFNWPGLDDNVL